MSAHTFDLAKLKALNLPRLTATEVFSANDDAAAADRDKYLDAYMAGFLPPATDWKCIGCDTKLTGIFGSFTFGLAHGEGHCASCGYPTRLFHRFAEGPVQFFKMPLQYHPADLEEHMAVAS